MSQSTPYQESILADHVSRELADWHVDGLLFTTFQYENDAFNDLILPAFLGEQVRPDKEVVRKATEKLTRTTLPYGCTVFADRRGVHEGEYGATGVIDLIPVVRRAVFHPKVCVALLRSKHLQGDRRKERGAFLMVSSANLTRYGWQSNIESVASRLLTGDQLVPLVEDVATLLESFAKEDTQNRPTFAQFRREFSSIFDEADVVTRARNDSLIVSGYGGKTFTEQLREKLLPIQDYIDKGMEMEVISPYTSKDGNGEPLRQLIETTKPSTVTMMLPLRRRGVVIWPPDYIKYIAYQGGDALKWGTLDEAILSYKNPQQTHYRNVHAKVYRWRSTTGLPLEVSVIGSHNLTTQAFSGTQNVEVSMLAFEHRADKGNAEPWLRVIVPPTDKVDVEEEPNEDDADKLEDIVPISITYDWASHQLWIKSVDGEDHQSLLFIEALKIDVVARKDAYPIELDPLSLLEAEKHLRARSFIEVQVVDVKQWLFVEQLNLEQKPWLSGEVTLEDLIEYLTTEEPKPKDVLSVATGGTIDSTALVEMPNTETLQDRMAGLLRIPVKLKEQIDRSQDGQLLLLKQRVSKHHPYSLWQLVEKLMKSSGTKFREEEVYLTFASLEQVLTLIKQKKGADTAYNEWVKAESENVKQLMETVQKNRITVRSVLKSRLKEEGIKADKLLAWLDDEITKPVKVADGR